MSSPGAIVRRLAALFALTAVAGRADVAPPLEPVWQVTRPQGFYAAPTVAGELVYATCTDGTILAVSAADGAVRWQVETGQVHYAGVAVGDGLAVTAGTDRLLRAFDALTGAVRWQYELDGLAYATPVIHEGLVYAGTGETGTIVCLEAATGAQRWSYAMGDRMGSALAVGDGLVVAGSFDHGVYCLDAATGELRWEYEAGGIVDSAPLLAGGRVYIKLPDDTVYALDAAGGAVLWESRSDQPPIDPTQISNWSNLALADGLLVFGSLDNHLYALAADTGEQRWRLAGADAFPAAPLVSGAWLFAGSKDGSLSAVEAATGELRWRWTVEQREGHPHLRGIMWPAVEADGRLYVASMDGHVTCLAPTGGELPAVEAPTEPDQPAMPELPPVNPGVPVVLDDPGTSAWKLTFGLAGGLLFPADARATARFCTADDGSGYALAVELGRLRLARLDGAAETLLADGPTAHTPQRVTLHRDGGRIRVLYDGEPVYSGWDDTYQTGPIELTVDGELRVTEPSVQPVEEIWFTDDFMRAAGEEHGDWRPLAGQWITSGVSDENVRRNEDKRPDPNFSSNPFAYRAADVREQALAVAGRWFWGEYRLAASVRPGERHADGEGPGSLGLAVLVADADNLLRFEWDHHGGGGERRLVAVENGRRKVLASADGGWDNDQWYRLAVEVTDDRCDVSIDGRRVLSSAEVPRGQGAVGLWARGVTFADFDDLQVATSGLLADRFDTPSGRWQADAGEWRLDSAAPGRFDPGVLALRSESGLVSTHNPAWSDLRFEAVGRAAGGGGLGLALLDADGHGFALRWGDGGAPAAWRGKLQFVRLGEGGEQVAAELDAGLDPASWHRLRLTLANSLLSCQADDRRLWTVPAIDFTPTRLGLLGAGPRTAFDSATVEPLPAAEPLEFEPPVAPQFAEEALMASWAQAGGSWRADQAAERGGVVWHRGRFTGRREVGLKPSLLRGGPLRLILAGDGQTAEAGLIAELTRRDDEAVAVELRLAGKPIGGGELPAEVDAWVLGLRDGYVTAAADRRLRLAVPLPAALDPSLIYLGLAARDGLELADVAVRAEDVLDTTFQRAPIEWLTAGGVWETTNRWKCDPRWSFFGAERDARPMIWSKEKYAGDVRIEAYVGIPMDLNVAPYYLNPSNLGVVLCGDGSDPASGYDLRFAAEDNTCTMLLRNGAELGRNTSAEARFKFVNAEGEGLIEFHRHWFHLVLERAGGRLRGWVDDVLLVDLPDEQPLAGGHVALYAIDNGISVSRVKVYHTASAQPAEGWNAAAWRGVEGDVGTMTSGDPATARGGRRRQ